MNKKSNSDRREKNILIVNDEFKGLPLLESEKIHSII